MPSFYVDPKVLGVNANRLDANHAYKDISRKIPSLTFNGQKFEEIVAKDSELETLLGKGAKGDVQADETARLNQKIDKVITETCLTAPSLEGIKARAPTVIRQQLQQDGPGEFAKKLLHYVVLPNSGVGTAVPLKKLHN